MARQDRGRWSRDLREITTGRPLYMATCDSNHEIMQMLLAACTDRNAPSGFGVSTEINPLQLATWLQQEDTIRVLLDHGGDVNWRSGIMGSSEQDAQCDRRYGKVPRKFNANRLDEDSPGTAIGWAVWVEDAAKGALLLGHRAHPETEIAYNESYTLDYRFNPSEAPLAISKMNFDQRGDTFDTIAAIDDEMYLQRISSIRILHLAVCIVNKEIVRVLLGNGAHVEPTRKVLSEPTSLHLAAILGDFGIAKLLLDPGADLDPKDVQGSTPLILAVERDWVEVVDTSRCKYRYEEFIWRNTFALRSVEGSQ